MSPNPQLAGVDLEALQVVKYPDPRLAGPSQPVQVIDDAMRALVEKMFELMFKAKGVGLAAPQVGLNLRMFVASPSYEPGDRRVYINPHIVSVDGAQESDEGCLSVPGVDSKIRRYSTVTVEATGLDGQVFQETGTKLVARIFQHEMDHLNGQLILDRMGSVSKLAHRRTIRELEEKFGQAK